MAGLDRHARLDFGGAGMFGAIEVWPTYLDFIPVRVRKVDRERGRDRSGPFRRERAQVGSAVVQCRANFAWQDGDTIPRRLLRPGDGSHGDIKVTGKARWTAGYWDVPLNRAMDTGNPMDDKSATSVPEAAVRCGASSWRSLRESNPSF